MAARGSTLSEQIILPNGGFPAWVMNNVRCGSDGEGESPHLLLTSAPVVGHRTASAGQTQLFQIFILFYFSIQLLLDKLPFFSEEHKQEKVAYFFSSYKAIKLGRYFKK